MGRERERGGEGGGGDGGGEGGGGGGGRRGEGGSKGGGEKAAARHRQAKAGKKMFLGKSGKGKRSLAQNATLLAAFSL